ncbi:MAG: hypothetical protein LDL19_02930 [Thiobacillus sp.]|nr:hypothetical protein [Thiobacillus sp.]
MFKLPAGKPIDVHILADGTALATAHPAKRLAIFVAASLAVHLLLMSAIRLPRPVTLPVESETVLQWVDLPARPIKADPRPAAPAAARMVSKHSLRIKESPPLAAPTPTGPISPPASSDAPPRPPSTLDPASLTTAARAIARDMAHADTPPPDAYTPPDERPILPKLAQALRREAAGERHLDNGVTRVVTARSQVLCFKTPPDFVRDGPVEMHALQVNCPR